MVGKIRYKNIRVDEFKYDLIEKKVKNIMCFFI